MPTGGLKPNGRANERMELTTRSEGSEALGSQSDGYVFLDSIIAANASQDQNRPYVPHSMSGSGMQNNQNWNLVPSWLGRNREQRTPMGPRTSGGVQPSVALVRDDLGKAWMEDDKCPVCRRCGLTFSLMKRRHHCRLCGQIFCSNCSSHWVPGRWISRSEEASARVCVDCYHYLQEVWEKTGNTTTELQNQASPSQSKWELTKGTLKWLFSSPLGDGTASEATPRTYPSTAPPQADSSGGSGAAASASGAAASASTSAAAAAAASSGSATGSGSGSGPARGGAGPGAGGGLDLTGAGGVGAGVGGGGALSSSGSAAGAAVAGSGGGTGLHTPMYGTERDDHDDEDEDDADSEEEGDTDHTRGHHSSDAEDGEDEEEEEEEEGSHEADGDEDQESVELEEGAEGHELNGEVIYYGLNIPREFKESHRRGLPPAATQHQAQMEQTLKSINEVERTAGKEGDTWREMSDTACRHFFQLIKERCDEVGCGMEDPKRVRALCKLATKVVTHLAEFEFKDDARDILRCVKVKRIPGGDMMKDSELVDGVVFSGDVVHRRMPSKLTECGVALLSEVVYDSVRGYTRLNDCVMQEDQLIGILVGKIAKDLSPPPKLLLCRGSISQVAREKLRENYNITCVQSVPQHILEAVGRCTGAKILESADKIGAGIENVVGTCKSFKVLRLGEAGAKSLVFMEGSGAATDRFATVCLRGGGDLSNASVADRMACMEMLTKAKSILLWAVRVGRHLQLESETLAELWSHPWPYSPGAAERSALVANGEGGRSSLPGATSSSCLSVPSSSNLVAANSAPSIVIGGKPAAPSSASSTTAGATAAPTTASAATAATATAAAIPTASSASAGPVRSHSATAIGSTGASFTSVVTGFGTSSSSSSSSRGRPRVGEYLDIVTVVVDQDARCVQSEMMRFPAYGTPDLKWLASSQRNKAAGEKEKDLFMGMAGGLITNTSTNYRDCTIQEYLNLAIDKWLETQGTGQPQPKVSDADELQKVQDELLTGVGCVQGGHHNTPCDCRNKGPCRSSYFSQLTPAQTNICKLFSTPPIPVKNKVLLFQHLDSRVYIQIDSTGGQPHEIARQRVPTEEAVGSEGRENYWSRSKRKFQIRWWCEQCNRNVVPLKAMPEGALNLSFTRFLEIFLHNDESQPLPLSDQAGRPDLCVCDSKRIFKESWLFCECSHSSIVLGFKREMMAIWKLNPTTPPMWDEETHALIPPPKPTKESLTLTGKWKEDLCAMFECLVGISRMLRNLAGMILRALNGGVEAIVDTDSAEEPKEELQQKRSQDDLSSAPVKHTLPKWVQTWVTEHRSQWHLTLRLLEGNLQQTENGAIRQLNSELKLAAEALNVDSGATVIDDRLRGKWYALDLDHLVQGIKEGPGDGALGDPVLAHTVRRNLFEKTKPILDRVSTALAALLALPNLPPECVQDSPALPSESSQVGSMALRIANLWYGTAGKSQKEEVQSTPGAHAATVRPPSDMAEITGFASRGVPIDESTDESSRDTSQALKRCKSSATVSSEGAISGHPREYPKQCPKMFADLLVWSQLKSEAALHNLPTTVGDLKKLADTKKKFPADMASTKRGLRDIWLPWHEDDVGGMVAQALVSPQVQAEMRDIWGAIFPDQKCCPLDSCLDRACVPDVTMDSEGKPKKLGEVARGRCVAGEGGIGECQGCWASFPHSLCRGHKLGRSMTGFVPDRKESGASTGGGDIPMAISRSEGAMSSVLGAGNSWTNASIAAGGAAASTGKPNMDKDVRETREKVPMPDLPWRKLPPEVLRAGGVCAKHKWEVEWEQKKVREVLTAVRNNGKEDSITYTLDSVGQGKWTIELYHPAHHHILRHYICGDDLNFARSMFKCRSISPEGGKSKATFWVSHDERFLIKEVKAKEMTALKKQYQDMLWYADKVLFDKLPSLLTMVVCSFKVSMQGAKSQYFVIQRNLRFDMLTMQHSIFDLKGLGKDRRAATDGKRHRDGLRDPDPRELEKEEEAEEPKATVLWDQNFREWAGGRPLCLLPNDLKYVEAAVWNDTLFLQNKGVVDYSLLCVVEQRSFSNPPPGKRRGEPRGLCLGIIDFLRSYAMGEKLERGVKTFVNNKEVTVQQPDVYAHRFRSTMGSFFVASL